MNILVNTNCSIYTRHLALGSRELLYAVIRPDAKACGAISDYISQITSALSAIKANNQGLRLICVRLYASDASTQADEIEHAIHALDADVAVSVVGQAPQPLSKLQATAVFEKCESLRRVDEHTIAAADAEGQTEYWTMHLTSPLCDSYRETHEQLERYEQTLQSEGMNIADHCMRTWFFVRDIDRNYSGVVEGRKENFLDHGLKPDTHYIASTGIEGKDRDFCVTSILDAVAVKGLQKDDVQILYASEYMNKTIEYGVTFERGVCVHRHGWKQVFVSGTASIDTKGEVLHVGDVSRQTYRMIENVKALLDEAKVTFADVAHAVVYLRDASDYDLVDRILSQYLPSGSYIITHAPVCRPTWLIEMEAVLVTVE